MFSNYQPQRKMTEEQLDRSVIELGRSAAVLSGDPKIAYRAEVLAMARRVSREGTPEQVAVIRRHIREHQGHDHRPFIRHVMEWDE
jgi:hypothetical protein